MSTTCLLFMIMGWFCTDNNLENLHLQLHAAIDEFILYMNIEKITQLIQSLVMNTIYNSSQPFYRIMGVQPV